MSARRSCLRMRHDSARRPSRAVDSCPLIGDRCLVTGERQVTGDRVAAAGDGAARTRSLAYRRRGISGRAAVDGRPVLPDLRRRAGAAGAAARRVRVGAGAHRRGPGRRHPDERQRLEAGRGAGPSRRLGDQLRRAAALHPRRSAAADRVVGPGAMGGGAALPRTRRGARPGDVRRHARGEHRRAPPRRRERCLPVRTSSRRTAGSRAGRCRSGRARSATSCGTGRTTTCSILRNSPPAALARLRRSMAESSGRRFCLRRVRCAMLVLRQGTWLLDQHSATDGAPQSTIRRWRSRAAILRRSGGARSSGRAP